MSTTTRDVAVPPGTALELRDYPRLAFTAPYFGQSPLGEMFAPAVREAAEIVIPQIIAPYVQTAADNAVQNLAVQRAGDTMLGPLFLNDPIPWQDSQAASKLYVDMMIASGGIPEVPAVPLGQAWVRELGAWVPLPSAPDDTFFLALSGGTMTGPINMGASPINNLAPVPVLPNGAAPATWVLDQIAARSLYQGTWQADTNYPDLTTPALHQNGFTWIAVLNDPASPVTVTAPIPGLQGQNVYNSDTIIFSSVAGQFQIIRGSGGITWPEAIASFLPLAGGSMQGPLILAEAPVADLEAATRAWVLSQIGSSAWADAPNDGQMYSRMHGLWALTANDPAFQLYLPLTGGTLTGALTLSGNATTSLGAVTLQQMNGAITSGLSGYLPLSGGTLSGPLTVNGTTAVNGTLQVSQAAAFSGAVTLAGNASVALQAVPYQQLQTYLPLTGGTLSGNLAVNGIVSVSGELRTNTVLRVNYAIGDDFWLGVQGANRVLNWANQWFDWWNQTSGLRGWSVGNIQLMTLDANGNLSVASNLSSTGNASIGGSMTCAFNGTFGGSIQTNATGIIYQQWSPQTVGYGWDNTHLWAFIGGVSIGYVTLTASDERLKRNIEPATEDCLAAINAIMLYSFDQDIPATPDHPGEHVAAGFSAQQLQGVIAEAVAQAGFDSDDEAQLAVRMMPVLARCVGAIQQLDGRLRAVEARQ